MIAAVHFVEGVADEEIAAMLADSPGLASRPATADAGPDRVSPGSTWVTREGVNIDRIASAWLIRRFIDQRARFKFVPSRGYRTRSGELTFDMAGARYTHVGEDCTFQTLVNRFGLTDAALSAIGEIVHDIDCKEELYGRPETAGVASTIRGLVRTTAGDNERLATGALIIEGLYAGLSRMRG